jgi:nucleotide-binding universal stress UspA family protein
VFPIRTILHPTDFSAHSEAAFRLACALAREHGGRLVVLYVNVPDVVIGEGWPLPPQPPEFRDSLKERLARIQPPDPSLRVERLVSDGDAVTEILRVAGEARADLIVMGTHGRGGLGRLLLGSIAEEVLRRAPCPVLTVKLPSLAAEERPAGAAEAVPS